MREFLSSILKILGCCILYFVATIGLFSPALAQTYMQITPAIVTAEVPLTDYFGNQDFTVDNPQNTIDGNTNTKWQGVSGNILPKVATAEIPLTDYFGNEGFTVGNPQNAIDGNTATYWQAVTGNVFPVIVTAENSSSDHLPAHTIDGNQSTYWWGTGDNPWIKFDLGEIRQVSGFRETSGGFPGNPFTAYVSTDDFNYVQVDSGMLTQNSYGEHVFSTRDVRYIKLYVERTDATGFGELVEFNALVNEAWIKLDLGEVRQVSGFRETSGGYPGNPFTAYVSTDDVNYEQVASGSLTQSIYGEHVFSTRDVRYIKLYVERTDATGFGELVEFNALVNEAWIKFDLGQINQVIGFRETSGSYPGNPYDIYVSSDDISYTIISSGILTEQGFGEHLLTNTMDVRYFKLFLQRTDAMGYGELAEFEALGESANTSPTANAGENISISSEEQVNIVLQGFAADPENDSLTFRWLEGTEVLAAGSVGANGEAYLDLSTVPYFSIGEHTLTLEVSDGQTTSTDEMILTVDNSAPHPAPSGGGSYEIGNPVTLAGQISDFDGDLLTYEWLKDSEILFTGSIKALNLGSPVDLPYLDVTNLTLGLHTLTLRVNDGINSPVVSDITVEIIDTSDPTVAPVPNKTILWPPNHKMVDIMIEANAADNSGNPVTLSATVTSNEPVDSLEDEDVAPDWSEPVIDQGNGTIALQLRSERSGSGSGRVYTIAITATDGSGNSSEALVEIIVPHDKRK